MTITLGTRLKVRAMVQLAAEPIPFFWPMRTFIHHNPLHGLEHLPFPEATAKGAKLFNGRIFLPRRIYQDYLAKGEVDRDALEANIDRFIRARDDSAESLGDVDLHAWLLSLTTEDIQPISVERILSDARHVHAVVQNDASSRNEPFGAFDLDVFKQRLRGLLLRDRPVYESVDALYGTQIGEEIDEQVIKSCLDFFDEGQAVWQMPGREEGLFNAWRELATRNLPFFLRGLRLKNILHAEDTPEGIIAHVLMTLGIPQDAWQDYLTRELTRLHGWTGFIRWRASAKRYYWSEQFPADLIDFVAIRMTLSLALLQEKERNSGTPTTSSAIEAAIDAQPRETFLRSELYGSGVLPKFAFDIEMTLARNSEGPIAALFDRYIVEKQLAESHKQAERLRGLAARVQDESVLRDLSLPQLESLLETIKAFEASEGMIWLEAMEARSMARLVGGLTLDTETEHEKRPFAQALFCIDTRSERIRRHLESVGRYETYGIAGFFGVPVSFMELGKGSEMHLCPAILTPKNLVPELTPAGTVEEAFVHAIDEAIHELKGSVLTPFVTVETIGMLFGIQMVGKIVAPQAYERLTKFMHPDKPATRLLLDKLSRDDAYSILRAAQRAVIGNAVSEEFHLGPEKITDGIVHFLRHSALGREDMDEDDEARARCAKALRIDDRRLETFIEHLRTDYNINQQFAEHQIEQLGRIGFTLDEQTYFVGQALRSIGLTSNFGRFVLLVGHGSRSENNAYESALDCGACGGNPGLISGRVLAQMANKTVVRRKLREQGIHVPDDTFFVPSFHNTTTDEIEMHLVEMMPPAHLVYLDRLRRGLAGATHLCAQERVPDLEIYPGRPCNPETAFKQADRNSVDWSQVRPEWGLARNAYFVIGRREITSRMKLDGRAFLHSYDYREDQNGRLLETIMTGPLVVGQWINMEHYFSAVDNERFGSGSKVVHNVAGRFGVMTGNLSDLRTGLPAQTVLMDGMPYHEPVRLIAVIEAPFKHAIMALDAVTSVKELVMNGWIRLLIADPETRKTSLFSEGEWVDYVVPEHSPAFSEASSPKAVAHQSLVSLVAETASLTSHTEASLK